MGYTKYTFRKVKKHFKLTEHKMPLFSDVSPISISDWLKQTLSISTTLTLNSEKARSEGIIAPFLFELKNRNPDKVALFSGENLDVNALEDLNGEVDFILTKTPNSTTIDAPIFCLMEAKQHIIESSLGQCVAQMIAAQIFNKTEKQELPTIYGCVTSGEVWQFLKLSEKTIYTDQNRYYLDKPKQILGILQHIVDEV
ncbi:MAG: hypothetical protein ACPGVB_09170 [Chitinophagales bacterium]